MRTRSQRRRYVGKWLVALIALLGSVIALLGVWSFSMQKVTLAQSAKQLHGPEPDAYLMIDEESFDIAVLGRLEDSLSRPLLSSTRKPYVAPPPPKPKPQPKPQPKPKEIPPIGEQLVSVIMAGDKQMIFLQGAEGTVRLELGMAYKGWKLIAINKDSAELQFDNEKKTLQLRTFANAVAPEVRQLGKKDK